MWAVPVPLVLSLSAGLALSVTGHRQVWVRTALAIWLVAFVSVGPMAVSADLLALVNIGEPKVPAGPFRVAQRVLAVARPGAPALVPEDIAVTMTGLPGCPPLIAVRGLYLDKLRGLVPDERVAARRALFRYAAEADPALSVDAVLDAIDARHVATVVIPEHTPTLRRCWQDSPRADSPSTAPASTSSPHGLAETAAPRGSGRPRTIYSPPRRRATARRTAGVRG
jgi:hypothetical protein